MEYWVRINGEKVGPLNEWDVRAKIDAGELNAESLAWHAGMDKWLPVSELTVFHSAFIIEEPPPFEEEEETQAPQVEKHFWVRRAFAKILDLFVYEMILFIIFGLMGLPMELGVIVLIQLVPFWFLEGYLTMRYGQTLGKWVLGLKLETLPEYGAMNYQRATIRSACAWFFGMALGIPPYYFLSMIVSYLTAGQRGTTTWDMIGKTKVVALNMQIRASQITSYIGMLALTMAVGVTFLMIHTPTLEKVAHVFSELAPEKKEQIYKTYNLPLPPTEDQ